MIALLFGITAVVSVITFTMAHFFHEDKRSYMNDWISIATRSTAAECSSLLLGYTEQLDLASLLILDEEMDDEHRASAVKLAGSRRNSPRMADVMMLLPGFLTPLMTMHMCSA